MKNVTKAVIFFGLIFFFLTVPAYAVNKYKIINHEVGLTDVKNTDKVFQKYYNKSQKEINNDFTNKILPLHSRNWDVCNESDLENIKHKFLSSNIQMIVLISRAGVNEECFKVNKKIGAIYRNTFTVGMSLIFYRITDSGDKTALQVYYNRFITGAKVVKTPEKLSENDKIKYFKDALYEGLKILVEKAHNEYNPEVVEGRVIRVDHNGIVTTLNIKDGLRIGNGIFLHIGKREVNLLIDDINSDKSIASIFEDFDVADKIRPGQTVTGCINAKRISNTNETFQLNKFMIKSDADIFKNNKEELAQIYRDYLLQTKKINMIPSKATMPDSVIDKLCQLSNAASRETFAIQDIVKSPKADYQINTVFQKTASKTLKQGKINRIDMYISYIVSGVVKSDANKLLLKERASESIVKNIIAGHTVIDKELLYDATQKTLKSLANKMADKIRKDIKLTN